MAATALLPVTAPFDVPTRERLDAVLLATTPMQRHWLAGFLAGLDAASGAATVVAQPVAPARPAQPLTIVYATESGNCETLAHAAAAASRKQGFRPRVIDMADLDVATLPKERDLLVIAATWGEGEPPARAAHPYAALMGERAPRLPDTRFSVLALGDTSYAGFCTIGKAIDARLEALGARRVADRVDCDLEFAALAKTWTANALKALAPVETVPALIADNVVAVDFTREVTNEPFTAEVTGKINLNSSRSDKQTFHLELDLGGARGYEPGDSLELHAPNDPTLVEAVLVAARLEPDTDLAAALTNDRDITTLSVPMIERYGAIARHPDLERLIEAGEARPWANGRQLVDLLEAFPADLTPEALTGLTRPLPPRAYSIASSRAAVGDQEAHLLIAAVRYETHGRPRHGVASTHVADRLAPGATIRARVKPNRHFRLPADPATDIIMIGPGTGVAPFRAFLQERAAHGASGRNWLFYGDRRFSHDFLYQLEWQSALEEGTLARLDLAFSRDGPAKRYVQHRILDRARDLVEWLDGGARFYVCGDAGAMAKDVRRALVDAYAAVKALGPEAAEAAVIALEKERRYLTDVY